MWLLIRYPWGIKGSDVLCRPAQDQQHCRWRTKGATLCCCGALKGDERCQGGGQEAQVRPLQYSPTG